MLTQTPEQHNRACSSATTHATEYAFVTGPGASEYSVTQSLVIQNNDAATQTLTVKLQTYSGSYASILTKEYAIAAGESEFLAEFMGQVLNGDASNPDKITIEYDVALTGSDTIHCVGSAVKFA